ncbi:hypothetical protein JCM33374_g4001 [Metschnikowia sp. JCM 33374]|nr:hypothetical protein JCM33374_g4001 [Metschnikowia sp. JCM 33374]
MLNVIHQCICFQELVAQALGSPKERRIWSLWGLWSYTSTSIWVLVATVTRAEDWYTKYLRTNMLQHMVKIQTENDKAKMYQVGQPWVSFLFDNQGRFFWESRMAISTK